MKSIRIAAVAAVLSAGPALAHVPAADHVLRRFAEKQAADRLESGSLQGRAWVPAIFGGGEREVLAAADVRIPGGCALRLELPDGAAAARLAGGRVSTEGSPQAALAAAVALGCPLSTLAHVPADKAEGTLKALAREMGVDAKTVSLTLFGRRPAYVIGARPQELGRPQIWFDKQSTRPTRIIARHEGQLWDVRLLDPASPATGRLQPRTVEVWKDGARMLAVRFLGISSPSQAPEDMEDTDEE